MEDLKNFKLLLDRKKIQFDQNKPIIFKLLLDLSVY